MATITLYEVEDSVVNRIAVLAQRNNVTIEDQIKKLLSFSIDANFRNENRSEIARRIAAMTPKEAIQTDSVLLLREDRER